MGRFLSTFKIYFLMIPAYSPIRIPREKYLTKLRAGKGIPFIKILTGIRRSGKSTLMKIFIDELISSGISKDEILFIDFDLDDDSLPKTHRELTDYVNSRYSDISGKLLFFDEIQNVDEWERSVGSFYNNGADIYLTGSNSNMLSSELSTRLSGRYLEIKVMPLMFSEYLIFRENTSNSIDSMFRDYCIKGSLPAVAKMCGTTSEELIPDSISGTFNTVYNKDIIERHNIRNPATLSNVIKFLMRNVGDRTSAKNVAGYLTSIGQKMAKSTIEDYIQYIESAYLVSHPQRFDSETRELLGTSDKFYATDLGIKHHVSAYRPDDIDGILENVVYNELNYRYNDVAILSVGGYEVDFVCDFTQKPKYFQVCYSLNSESTLNREVRPLSLIEDNYPKTIITYERYPLDDIDGIRVVNVIDWLLENE